MAESILSASNVLLYGRELDDLKIDTQVQIPDPLDDSAKPPDIRPHQLGRGANRFLRNQIDQPDARLARIYGFSYEGRYYDLAAPAIFLVHGPGAVAERGVTAVGHEKSSRGPDIADRSGSGAQEHAFSEDIKVWAYDRNDFSIRMDIDTGSIEQILLEAELAVESGPAQQSGARVSGARARGARVAGGRVGGGRVGGGRVGGRSDGD